MGRVAGAQRGPAGAPRCVRVAGGGNVGRRVLSSQASTGLWAAIIPSASRIKRSVQLTTQGAEDLGWPSAAGWTLATIAWLVVAVLFVLIYVAVGVIMEALFGIRLRRHDNSDGTDSAG